MIAKKCICVFTCCCCGCAVTTFRCTHPVFQLFSQNFSVSQFTRQDFASCPLVLDFMLKFFRRGHHDFRSMSRTPFAIGSSTLTGLFQLLFDSGTKELVLAALHVRSLHDLAFELRLRSLQLNCLQKKICFVESPLKFANFALSASAFAMVDACLYSSHFGEAFEHGYNPEAIQTVHLNCAGVKDPSAKSDIPR